MTLSEFTAMILNAGFQCTRATAYVNGHRLSRKPDVAHYIATMRHLEYEERTRAHEEAWQSRLRELRR